MRAGGRRGGVEEEGVQVAAVVDDAVGAVGGVGGYGDLVDERAVGRVDSEAAVDDVRAGRGVWGGWGEVPGTREDFGGVGLEGDGGADFAQEAGLLEDGDGAVGAAEGDGLVGM